MEYQLILTDTSFNLKMDRTKMTRAMKKHCIFAVLFLSTAIVSAAEQPAPATTDGAPKTSEETAPPEENSWNEVGESIKESSGKTWEVTKETSKEVWEATTEMSSEAWDATKSGSSKAWQATKETTGEAWEATKEGSAKAWDATKAAVSDE